MNREQGSIGMIFGLDGWVYGPQFNIARENFIGGMTDCFDAPLWAKKFDDQTYLLDKKSTHCLMSKSDSGVQTGETFLELLRNARRMIDDRNVAEARSPCRSLVSEVSSQHIVEA